MTELKRSVPVPATTREERRIQCGLCDRMTEWGESEWRDPKNGYARHAVKIEAQREVNYPDSGHSEGVAFDCCPDCFQKMVRPALIDLGLKPRKTEASW